MTIREKWNRDEKYLMHRGKFGSDFTLSWNNGMRRYIFKFVINKMHEVDQCEETEYYDCVHSDDINKPWQPIYYCVGVAYFNNEFGREVKQFDLY